MKTTRQLFIITGKDENLRTVFDVLDGFKAIIAMDKNVSTTDIEKTFNCNKSVVCRGIVSSNMFYHLTPIYITCIGTDETIMPIGNVIKLNSNIILQFMEIASKYNVDIGDHVSNTTSKSSHSEDNCLFCKLLAGKPIHKQDPLYETTNFLVVPGSGAFIDGYLMILPKSHVMSCAELSPEERVEMENVIVDVKFLLRSIYSKNVLIWENGSGVDGHGKPKTSIVHAHIHACPCSLDILQATTLTGITLKQIDKYSLANYSRDSYLFVINYDNKWYICCDTNLYIPRQYVRQLLAIEQNINTDLWDWRSYPFWSNVEKTGKVFLEYVRNNYDYLPERIQNATRKFI